ncbi:MAG: 4-alpha-glucanotransferase [Acholeplasmatales bacterium]|jgi:4-alpha-glucanotransferase|nr:4-alpha-glucanotransferase [Acholeplasmatales bacterium]
MERSSGILLPIFSLYNKYGIGTFGKKAYDFVDFLVKAKIKYWQILPLGHTSYGDSPYQSFSTNALNPYFIDINFLIDEGLLKAYEADRINIYSKKIDYLNLYIYKTYILKRAFLNFDENKKEYLEFKASNSSWLDDYAYFMAIKNLEEGVSLLEWRDELKFRNKKALDELKNNLDFLRDVRFYSFVQFKAFEQYEKLLKYANINNVEIIGDLPIYVAMDSVDVWTHKNLFKIDDKFIPKEVAGVPPDYFSELGQLWGNPLYNWEAHKEEKYKWWIERIKSSFKLYNCLRIDHFIGFTNYCSVPFEDTNAKRGVWNKGPGYSFFEAIKKECGDLKIIAEDLGEVTEEVREVLKETGFPGMKIIQFAFDGNNNNPNLPKNYLTSNLVLYTGTHDNDTLETFIRTRTKKELGYIRKYTKDFKGSNLRDKIIDLSLSSVAQLVIIPAADYLGLDVEARINCPGTCGTNWVTRLEENALTDSLAEEIRGKIERYNR